MIPDQPRSQTNLDPRPTSIPDQPRSQTNLRTSFFGGVFFFSYTT